MIGDSVPPLEPVIIFLCPKCGKQVDRKMNVRANWCCVPCGYCWKQREENKPGWQYKESGS